MRKKEQSGSLSQMEPLVLDEMRGKLAHKVSRLIKLAPESNQKGQKISRRGNKVYPQGAINLGLKYLPMLSRLSSGLQVASN